jgi:hypothetical protein
MVNDEKEDMAQQWKVAWSKKITYEVKVWEIEKQKEGGHSKPRKITNFMTHLGL